MSRKNGAGAVAGAALAAAWPVEPEAPTGKAQAPALVAKVDPTAEVFELNGLERVLLLQVLPAEGNLFTIKVVHELRQALALTSEEIAGMGKDGASDVVPYEVLEGIAPVPFPITAVQRRIIGTALTALDKAQKIGDRHIPLYVKFPIDKRR